MVNSASPAALPRICFQNFALRASPASACPSACGQGLALCGYTSHTQALGNLSNIYIITPSALPCVIIRSIIAANPTYCEHARRRIRPPGASAAVSLRPSARAGAVSTYIISTPPAPRAHRRPVKPLPCACSPSAPAQRATRLRPCVRQLCPASAGARACALDKQLDISKRLHSASRTAAKTYNRRSTRRRSPRPRPAVGDDYTVSYCQACRNVSHLANLASACEGGADRLISIHSPHARGDARARGSA